MEKSKVYFTNFRTIANGDGLPKKLEKLIKKAGIANIDMEEKFVAIKMHFGEHGNLSFLRPNYARAVVNVVKELGGKPFLTDCNTMYVGSRKNGLDHLYCAWENGFTPLSVDCPVIIADGIKGLDDINVPVDGGEYVKEAKIGRAIMDADVFISLAHFKGHEATGFGGTLKNIGMGCGSRAGKTEQHCSGKPRIKEIKCRGCRRCQAMCANGGLVYLEDKKKMSVDYDKCVGCGRCLGACNFNAISFANNNAPEMLEYRMAEYAKAVTDGRPCFYINIVRDISPNCDCHGENDVPILPDIGMFASFDPVALDQACADALLACDPMPNSQLSDNLAKPGFVPLKDHFCNSQPDTEWEFCLAHAEKLGMGSREYEIVEI